MAIKTTSGLDPVSDCLSGAKSYLGEELADRMSDDDAIEQAMDYQKKARLILRRLLAKQVTEKHECKDNKRCVRFKERMELVDDGGGGKVWVSKENVQAWEDAHCTLDLPNSLIPPTRQLRRNVLRCAEREHLGQMIWV